MGVHEDTTESQEEGNGSASTTISSVVGLYTAPFCLIWWKVRRGAVPEVVLLQQWRGGSVASEEVCDRSAASFMESKVTLTPLTL